MRQRFNVIFWLGIVAFILVSSLSAWRMLQLHNEIRLRDQTSAIEQKLTELYNTLLEADVTFLVLRNSQQVSDAKKLLRLVKEAHRHVDELSKMVNVKNPIHQEVADLHDMVSEKLTLSEKIMLNMDLDSDEPFQKVLVIQNDLLLTQKVNRKIQTIEAFLITNLNQHRAYVDRYFTVNLLSIGAAAAVAFSLLLTFAGLVWSEIRRRRMLEGDLRQAQRAAIHASELKSQFLATVSHEVRTPLNGIIGMSELLQQRLQGESARFAGVIHASSKTLLRIVSDLLDFSKIEANKINVEIQEVRPSHILETAIDLFSPRATQKRLRLYCTYPREFDDVYAADGVRIAQVTHNLLGNAVKFTKQGFVEVKGRVISTNDDQLRLRIEVSDTGPGIEAGKTELIFQPFFQLQPDFQNEGTGLGLSISKRLVDLMGGQIGLQNRPGGGSIFWFDLPLRRLKRDVTASNSSLNGKRFGSFGLATNDLAFLRETIPLLGGQFSDQDSATAKNQDVIIFSSLENAEKLTTTGETWLIGFEPDLINENRQVLAYPLSPDRLRKAMFRQSGVTIDLPFKSNLMKSVAGAGSILLVEDNPTNQLLAQTQLEQLGYRVRLASNGVECLEALRESQYSAVLMDCRMPVMDGFTVTRLIREKEQADRRPRVPIIAMTANALEDDRRRCLAAGMDDHIAKPIETQQLHRLIQKWAPNFAVVIDWQVVRDLEKKTSKQVIKKLFQSFKETLTQAIEQFQTYSDANNWTGLGNLCHQLRSAAAAVGALTLSRELERVEMLIDHKMEPTIKDIADLSNLSRAVLDEITKEINSAGLNGL